MNSSGNGIQLRQIVFLLLSAVLSYTIYEIAEVRSAKVAEKVTKAIMDNMNESIIPTLKNEVINSVQTEIGDQVRKEVEPLQQSIQQLQSDVNVNKNLTQETKSTAESIQKIVSNNRDRIEHESRTRRKLAFILHRDGGIPIPEELITDYASVRDIDELKEKVIQEVVATAQIIHTLDDFKQFEALNKGENILSIAPYNNEYAIVSFVASDRKNNHTSVSIPLVLSDSYNRRFTISRDFIHFPNTNELLTDPSVPLDQVRRIEAKTAER